MLYDTSVKRVVYETADFHKPWNIGVTPDPAIQALINDLNTQLGPIFNTVIGSSTVTIPRADSCGTPDGRRCESKIGDTVTDAMRKTYDDRLRDHELGRPPGRPDVSGGGRFGRLLPVVHAPPYPITRGQVLGGAPVREHHRDAVGERSRAEDDARERGVARCLRSTASFAQVSGLCFTYDITAVVGNRVTGAVRQAADGSCTGAPVDLTAASTYSIAENDFMVAGGDGYPVFSLAGRDAGDHGRGGRRLRDGELAAQSVDPGAGQLHRRDLPGRHAVSSSDLGGAASAAPPSLCSAAPL